MSKIATRNVPCEGCTQCCQGDAVFLHPELGDKFSDYITEIYKGRFILAHQANGDCIYLERGKGCTIHERRPAICRELDCADILKWPKSRLKRLVAQGKLSEKLLMMAKLRVERDKAKG